MPFSFLQRLLSNSRLVILTVLVLVIAGLSAIATLPIAEDPIIRNRNAAVSTLYPGASAERVESLITDNIEEKLRQLDEIKLLTSTSRAGLSLINIELKDEVMDSDSVWSRVRDKLNDVQPQLPKASFPPKLDSDHSYAFTTIIALTWNDNNSPSDLLLLKRYSTELAKQLRAINGTEFVDEYGLPEEEILVTLDPNATTSLQQSAMTISNTIQGAETTRSTGELINDSARFNLEISKPLDSLYRLGQVPIHINEQGHLIQLQDIATVQRQATSPPESLAFSQQQDNITQPSVMIAARMQANLRINQWNNKVHKVLKQYRLKLPSNINASVIFEQQGYTEQRITELLKNLLLGFVIILVVLLLTLGIRSALIVALSLPLTSLLTLALMKYTNIPINQMSVTGLIVALGIMVDNAIVMVDTIAHYRQQGKKQLDAAIQAIKHLWLPLLGSTLTTVLAFSPIILMPGPSGEFVGAIAITVSFALLGSYVVSHFIVAALAGRWLPVQTDLTPWYQKGIRLPTISDLFEKSVQWAVYNPIKTIGLSLILPITGFWGAGQLTEQFFPPSDRDIFEIQVFLSPESSIYQTQTFVSQLDKNLHQYSEVTQTHWMIGNNLPSFYYNLVVNQKGMSYLAQAMVTTSNFQEANRLIKDLQQTLPSEFPNAQIVVRKLEQGPPFNAPIELFIYGDNLHTLKQIGDDLRLLLSQQPEIKDSKATLQSGLPKVGIEVDEVALQFSELSLTQFAATLQSTLMGQTDGHLMDGQEQLPIRVRVAEDHRETLPDFSNLRITTASQPVGIPISAITQLELQPSLGAIPHRNGNRVNTVEGFLISDVLPQTVLNRLLPLLTEYQTQLPSGYRIEIGGESAKRNESVNSLMANLFLIILLMIMILVISFNSFRFSIIVFSVSGLASALGLLSVWLFNYPFGFTVIIALLGLIGLAINAAIVILSEFKINEKAMQGNQAHITQGVMNCTRHITSTTITTIGGFLPLILAGGGFWPPFAIAIAGGTLFTTLLSFYFVPASFTLLMTLTNKKHYRFRSVNNKGNKNIRGINQQIET